MWRKISIVLAVLCNLVLWVDVFTYSGYLSSVLGLPSKILLILSLVISSFIFLIPSPTQARYMKPIVFFTIFVSFIYLFSITIEGLQSQGYVYSVLHMRPESMLYPTLSLIVFAIALSLRLKGSTSLRYITFLLYVSVSFYFLRQMPIVLVEATSLIKTIALAPNATYDDKMRSQWGSFYDYMLYLKEHLPKEGTTLGIPPQQNPWLLYGNGMLVQSFVYPTIVINLDATGSGSVMPKYIMQLPDWPVDDHATGSAKWGLIKL